MKEKILDLHRKVILDEQEIAACGIHEFEPYMSRISEGFVGSYKCIRCPLRIHPHELGNYPTAAVLKST